MLFLWFVCHFYVHIFWTAFLFSFFFFMSPTNKCTPCIVFKVALATTASKAIYDEGSDQPSHICSSSLTSHDPEGGSPFCMRFDWQEPPKARPQPSSGLANVPVLIHFLVVLIFDCNYSATVFNMVQLETSERNVLTSPQRPNGPERRSFFLVHGGRGSGGWTNPLFPAEKLIILKLISERV